jgi:phage terminase small subunit
MPALKYREELFAHEVAAFTPPDRAYLTAGFRSRPEFARGNACRLLRKPEVAKRIDELREEFRSRCALHVEYLQELLLPIVEANPLDYFKTEKAKGSNRNRTTFKDLKKLRREQGLAISSLKLSDEGTVAEVKFHGKNEAAKTLLATLGIEESKQSQNVFVMNLGERVRTALAQVDSDPPMMPAVTTRAIDDAPVIDAGTEDSTDHPDEADEASDDVIEVIECDLE